MAELQKHGFQALTGQEDLNALGMFVGEVSAEEYAVLQKRVKTKALPGLEMLEADGPQRAIGL